MIELKRLTGVDRRGDIVKVSVELALFQSEIEQLTLDGRALDMKVEVIVNEFLRGDGDLRDLREKIARVPAKAAGAGG